MKNIVTIFYDWLDARINPNLEKAISKYSLMLSMPFLIRLAIELNFEYEIDINSEWFSFYSSINDSVGFLLDGIGIALLIIGLFFYHDSKTSRLNRDKKRSDISNVSSVYNKYNVKVIEFAINDYLNNRIYNSIIWDIQMDIDNLISSNANAIFDDELVKNLKIINSYLIKVISIGQGCMINLGNNMHRFPRSHEPSYYSNIPVLENNMEVECLCLSQAMSTFHDFLKNSYPELMIN